MRKSLVLLLALVLLMFISVNAFSENDFQLHNGVLFGDTLETVKAKEEGTLTIQSDSEEKTDKVWFDGTIAGMEGSVRFDFDEKTNTLTDMLYSFDSSSNKDSIDNQYSKLRDSLIRKYGTPLGNTGGTLHAITGTAIEYAATLILLYQYIEGDGDLRDYDEWIVDSNGYHVKIDLVSVYYRTKNYDYTYLNSLSYHYYTDEDLINYLNEKQAENDIIDNDL